MLRFIREREDEPNSRTYGGLVCLSGGWNRLWGQASFPTDLFRGNRFCSETKNSYFSLPLWYMGALPLPDVIQSERAEDSDASISSLQFPSSRVSQSKGPFYCSHLIKLLTEDESEEFMSIRLEDCWKTVWTWSAATQGHDSHHFTNNYKMNAPCRLGSENEANVPSILKTRSQWQHQSHLEDPIRKALPWQRLWQRRAVWVGLLKVLKFWLRNTQKWRLTLTSFGVLLRGKRKLGWFCQVDDAGWWRLMVRKRCATGLFSAPSETT